MGRGVDHFFTEGAKIDNTIKFGLYPDPYEKRARQIAKAKRGLRNSEQLPLRGVIEAEE
jgi:hypothetical protein